MRIRAASDCVSPVKMTILSVQKRDLRMTATDDSHGGRVAMTRQEKVLRHVDKGGVGLEIGSSYNSIAAKRDGYNVQVIDHATREELISKFRHHRVDVDSIAEVDFVWQGEDYAALTGRPKAY